MAYRNGIYVAFNGCGTTNPTDSDIKYFNILKAWKENKKIDFSFVDSHQKTYRVLDSSTKETLLSRLNERMANSKLMFLIVTNNTSNCSDIVEHEIKRAVEVDKIPLVIAYVDKEVIKKTSPQMRDKLPKILNKYIDNNDCKALFIPFKREAIACAFKNFDVHKTKDKNNSIYVYQNVEKWED